MKHVASMHFTGASHYSKTLSVCLSVCIVLYASPQNLYLTLFVNGSLCLYRAHVGHINPPLRNSFLSSVVEAYWFFLILFNFLKLLVHISIALQSM